MKYWQGQKIEKLEKYQIFVFGSNPKGIHGAGAAKEAVNFGAKYGIGRGLVGQTYALVTKNLDGCEGFIEKSTGITYEKGGYRSLSKEQIKKNIAELYEVARENPNLDFLIGYTYDYCQNGKLKKGLNGYDSQEMLEMFVEDLDIPNNIVFHESYKNKLNY